MNEIPSEPSFREQRPSETQNSELDLRTDLLIRMRNIPSYPDREDFSGIGQAFAEVSERVQGDDEIYAQLSALKISKAFIEESSLSGESVRDPQSLLLRYMIGNAVQNEPELFGGFAEDITKFLSELEEHEHGQQDRWIQQKKEELDRMEIGEKFPDINPEQERAQQLIEQGKPIVLNLTGSRCGIGDVLLSLPAVEDLAATFEAASIQSPIKLVVRGQMEGITRALLGPYVAGDNPRVEVIPQEESKTDPLLLRNLAHKNDSESNGIVLTFSWKRSKEEQGNPDAFSGLVHTDMNYHAMQLGEDKDDPHAGTLRNGIQFTLSHTLGMKVTETETSGNLSEYRNRFNSYLDQWVSEQQESGKPTLRDIAASEAQVHGFPEGYICIVESGSDEIKRLSPRITGYISESLSDVCRENGYGVVLIRTENNTPWSQDDIESSMTGVPHIILSVDKSRPLEDTFVLLRGSKGVISPDTGLVHAGEYLHDATLDVHADSNSNYYRLNGSSVIAVEHPIAEQVRKRGRVYSKRLSPAYNTITHPLSIPGSEDVYHPFVDVMQRGFIKNLDLGLLAFKTRIQNTTAQITYL